VSPSTLLTVMVSGLLALAAWSRLAELHRKAALARAARARGLRFEDHAGRFIVGGPGKLPVLRLGGAVGRYLVTDGTLAVFEHLARGPSATAWRPLAAARVTGVPAFRLEARRPGVLGLAAAVFTPDDEVGLDVPDFDERYQLFADDRVTARGLFTDPVVAFFVARPGFCLEVRGDWLVVEEGLGPLDPAALSAQLDGLRALVTLLERAAATARGDDRA